MESIGRQEGEKALRNWENAKCVSDLDFAGNMISAQLQQDGEVGVLDVPRGEWWMSPSWTRNASHERMLPERQLAGIGVTTFRQILNHFL